MKHFKNNLLFCVATTFLTSSFGFAGQLSSNQALLNSTQKRLLVDQIQALGALNDMGMIQINRNEIAAKLAPLNRKANDMESMEKSFHVVVGATLSTTLGLIFMNDIVPEVLSGKNNPSLDLVSSGTSVGSMMFAGLEKNASDEARDARSKIGQTMENSLDSALNDEVRQTEQFYALSKNQQYLSQRDSLVSNFKNKVYFEIGAALDNHENLIQASISNYADYLSDSSILKREKVEQMKLIFSVLKTMATTSTDLPTAQLELQQANNLSSILNEAIAQSQNAEQKAELSALNQSVQKEIEILKLMQ